MTERILPRLGRRDAVDSIRNPTEVEVLRRMPRFVLIGIRAPAELRYERSRSRARSGDPTTFEEFRMRERQEEGTSPTAQQLSATFALADRIVENDGDLARLHRRIDDVVATADGRDTAARQR